MNVTHSTVRLLEISGAPALDPIRVLLQDTQPGAGRLIIECYGRAWSAYWGAIGRETIAGFVAGCSRDPEYIVRALCSGTRSSKHDDAYLLRIVKAVQAALSEGGFIPSSN